MRVLLDETSPTPFGVVVIGGASKGMAEVAALVAPHLSMEGHDAFDARCDDYH